MAQALTSAKAKVAVVARTEAELDETVTLIRKAGGHVLAVPTGVTNRKAVEQMVQTVQRDLSAADIQVNSVHPSPPPDRFGKRFSEGQPNQQLQW